MFYDLAIKKDVLTCFFHLVEPLPEISRFDLMKSITLRRPFLKKYIEISNINVSRTKIILIFTLTLLEKKTSSLQQIFIWNASMPRGITATHAWDNSSPRSSKGECLGNKVSVTT